MVTVVPADQGYGDIGANFVKGYQSRSDELALKKTIERLPKDASPRDVLDAVTNTKTYSDEGKKEYTGNYIKSYGLESKMKTAQEKEATRAQIARDKIAAGEAKTQAELDKENRVIDRERNDAKAILELSGQYTPEQINKAVKSGISPTSARTVSRPAAEATYEKTSDKLAAERASKYIGEVENAAKSAQGDIVGLDIQDALGKEGATGFNKRNASVDWMQEKGIISENTARALKDPKSVTYNSVSKIQMRSFGEIVKGKVSDREFATLRGMLAQAEDSPEAAEAMVETQRLIRNISIAENEMMQNIIRESADQGKGPPSDIAYQTEKRIRPIADQLSRQSTAKIQKILRPGPKVPDKVKSKLDQITDSYVGKKQ